MIDKFNIKFIRERGVGCIIRIIADECLQRLSKSFLINSYNAHDNLFSS